MFMIVLFLVIYKNDASILLLKHTKNKMKEGVLCLKMVSVMAGLAFI